MKPVGILLSVLVALAAIGCASEEAQLPGERLDAKRTKLIATCPSEAPDTYEVQEALAKDRGLDRVIREDESVLDPVTDVAIDYVKGMPRKERTWPWIDHVRNRIVVPVTEHADGGKVLSDLRSRIDDPETITIETVRYSDEELTVFARQIDDTPELGLSGITYDGGLNNTVLVRVTGDAQRAREKILASTNVDPCAFEIQGNSEPLPET